MSTSLFEWQVHGNHTFVHPVTTQSGEYQIAVNKYSIKHKWKGGPLLNSKDGRWVGIQETESMGLARDVLGIRAWNWIWDLWVQHEERFPACELWGWPRWYTPHAPLQGLGSSSTKLARSEIGGCKWTWKNRPHLKWKGGRGNGSLGTAGGRVALLVANCNAPESRDLSCSPVCHVGLCVSPVWPLGLFWRRIMSFESQTARWWVMVINLSYKCYICSDNNIHDNLKAIFDKQATSSIDPNELT